MIKKREGNSILQQQVPGWVMNQMPAVKEMYCFSLVFGCMIGRGQSVACCRVVRKFLVC